MARASVFYSWQSDLASKTNRGLIQDALERAAKRLRADESLGVEPVIDRDTQGIAGSPDIHAAILNKIRDCDAAVFDVSFVEHGTRELPNPNVLIELGYALGTIGSERVVLVFNTKHGEVEKLPFDIRTKRVLTYSMAEDEEPAHARNYLAAAFEQTLKTILKEHPKESQEDRTATVVGAFHDGKPGAIPLLRGVLGPLVSELSAKRPVARESEHIAEAVMRAFNETAPLVAVLAELVTAVVDCWSAEGFALVLRGIESLANAQSSAEPGVIRREDFDVQRVLVREAITVVTAICLKNQNWDFLRTLTTGSFSFRYELRERVGGFATLMTDFSALHTHARARQSNVVDLVVDVMKSRYAAGLSGVQLNDLREADYFLYEATELQGNEQSDFGRWFPFFFARGLPRLEHVEWLRRCRSASWLAKVAASMGLSETDFKARYEQRWQRVSELFRDLWLGHELSWVLLEPKELGSQP